MIHNKKDNHEISIDTNPVYAELCKRSGIRQELHIAGDCLFERTCAEGILGSPNLKAGIERQLGL